MGVLRVRVAGAWVDIGTSTGPYVPLAGGTMTGPLAVTYTSGAPSLRLNGDGSFIGFFDNANNRRGYLQGNSNGVLLASESGALTLNTNVTIGGVLTFPNGMTLTGAVSDTWMRPSGNVYVGNGILGAGPNGFCVGTGGLIAGGNIADFGGQVYFRSNLSFSSANPIISASSYINMPGGLYVSGGILYSQGVLNARGTVQNDSGTYAPAVRILGSGANYSAGWTTGTQMHLEDTTGAQHSALCMWTGPSAPILRNYGPFGDRYDFLNNPNTAYCQICASAFTVQSSERIKHDIAAVDDDELLATMTDVRTHTFVPNTRPMTIPLTDRFIDLNRRWIARGRRPLTPSNECFGGPAEPHDCYDPRHYCLGAPDHPCPIAKNDTSRFGLIAEHLHDHVPEAVSYGEDELPAGYDVDQVAAMAFGGVGALLRKIEVLQSRVDDLESEVIYQQLGAA